MNFCVGSRDREKKSALWIRSWRRFEILTVGYASRIMPNLFTFHVHVNIHEDSGNSLIPLFQQRQPGESGSLTCKGWLVHSSLLSFWSPLQNKEEKRVKRFHSLTWATNPPNSSKKRNCRRVKKNDIGQNLDRMLNKRILCIWKVMLDSWSKFPALPSIKSTSWFASTHVRYTEIDKRFEGKRNNEGFI